MMINYECRITKNQICFQLPEVRAVEVDDDVVALIVVVVVVVVVVVAVVAGII